MRIEAGHIVIRSAELRDAPILNRWWNDGRIMADLGYPDGLGESLEETRAVIQSWEGRPDQLCIIEIGGVPAGELSYRLKRDGAAYPGWMIAETRYRNQGFGSRVIRLLFHFIFTDKKINEFFPIDRIVWDTPVDNKRARHVYEVKIRAVLLEIREDSFQDQRGNWRSMALYEMSRDRFFSLNLAETDYS